jgi:hypothetical protein
VSEVPFTRDTVKAVLLDALERHGVEIESCGPGATRAMCYIGLPNEWTNDSETLARVVKGINEVAGDPDLQQVIRVLRAGCTEFGFAHGAPAPRSVPIAVKRVTWTDSRLVEEHEQVYGALKVVGARIVTIVEHDRAGQPVVVRDERRGCLIGDTPAQQPVEVAAFADDVDDVADDDLADADEDDDENDDDDFEDEDDEVEELDFALDEDDDLDPGDDDGE